MLFTISVRYYAYKQGLSMVKTKEDLKFLLALEESLEELKASETKRVGPILLFSIQTHS